MTNYEKIKYLLEMWVYKGVEVMYEDTDPTINNKSIIDTMRDLDLWSVWNKDRLDITSITPIPNPPKLLLVGTKVRVFEEYDDKYWKMEWLYSIYEQLDWQYALLWISYWQSYVVPARAVYPVLD